MQQSDLLRRRRTISGALKGHMKCCPACTDVLLRLGALIDAVYRLCWLQERCWGLLKGRPFSELAWSSGNLKLEKVF